jgi:serine O-acetyltransferase
MLLEISKKQLQSLVQKQLNNIFFLRDEEIPVLFLAIELALNRSEKCFSHTNNKYYKKNKLVYFNPFHSGQYSIFLYFLSNSIFKIDESQKILADKIYYLNKCLNGLDLFYEVSMPKVFFLDHPVGTVLGRATYGEFFSFSQNCTVGNNKGVYPVFGKNVVMFSGSTVIGRCSVGNNVTISANSYIKDENIPPCSIVFGSSPNIVIKKVRAL